MKRHNLVLFLATLVASGWNAHQARAIFDIELLFDGDYTPAQQEMANQAAGLWEDRIIGYQPGISLNGITIHLETFTQAVSGTLGRSFPPTTVLQAGYRLSTGGRFQLDTLDIPWLEASGRLDDVFAHEMGHLLGVGTLWESNQLYTHGSGEYLGPFGVLAYNAEFGQSGAFVPVELDGGPGTANAHWNENEGGRGFTGIRDAMGRDFRDELMTGRLNQNPFLSHTTVQSLRDLGFAVVPEPHTLTILLAGIILWAGSDRCLPRKPRFASGSGPGRNDRQLPLSPAIRTHSPLHHGHTKGRCPLPACR